MQLTYEIFAKKAKEAKAKFPGKKGTQLPIVTGLKVSETMYEIIKDKIAVGMEPASPFLIHNYLRISSSPYVPENMMLCEDKKGTIIGAVKIGKDDE